MSRELIDELKETAGDRWTELKALRAECGELIEAGERLGAVFPLLTEGTVSVVGGLERGDDAAESWDILLLAASMMLAAELVGDDGRRMIDLCLALADGGGMVENGLAQDDRLAPI